jgi:hypothetical protein
MDSASEVLGHVTGLRGVHDDRRRLTWTEVIRKKLIRAHRTFIAQDRKVSSVLGRRVTREDVLGWQPSI